MVPDRQRKPAHTHARAVARAAPITRPEVPVRQVAEPVAIRVRRLRVKPARLLLPVPQPIRILIPR
ncbi:MAG: hypothetical protein IT580_23945 [Verrucomicrobiales bacterium]|nr:hypothetical protein [Verrucomicrobiales bacterium]